MAIIEQGLPYVNRFFFSFAFFFVQAITTGTVVQCVRKSLG